jgi:hypothetical protein
MKPLGILQTVDLVVAGSLHVWPSGHQVVDDQLGVVSDNSLGVVVDNQLGVVVDNPPVVVVDIHLPVAVDIHLPAEDTPRQAPWAAGGTQLLPAAVEGQRMDTHSSVFGDTPNYFSVRTKTFN